VFYLVAWMLCSGLRNVRLQLIAGASPFWQHMCTSQGCNEFPLIGGTLAGGLM
jgi:hypothetical protein